MINSLIKALVTIATWELMKFKVKRAFKKANMIIRGTYKKSI